MDAALIPYHPYRQSRCIIPASAFIEGLGDSKTYHKIQIQNQAIAFGAISMEYVNKKTSEIIRRASITTLGPLAEWEGIHAKVSSMVLPLDKDLLVRWIDSQETDVEHFEPLLQLTIGAPQIVTPLGKVRKWKREVRQRY